MPCGPILIVDDEPGNLAILREILSPDYPLIFATNGEDALDLARKQKPAMVLLDIQMPDMNGYQVCQHLRSDPETENIPVIFVSSLREVIDETTALQLGGVDYLIKPVVPALTRARVRNHLSLVRSAQLEKSYRDAIFMLGEAGHYNDTDTGAHIWRMAAMTQALARAAGWDDDACRLIELAAPMHDTGKIGIPNAILRKRGPLDADQWKIMKTHVAIGHEILSKSDAPVFRLAAVIALNHHEKWDGSGYPNGLVGLAIPEAARIVAVADVFDALTMKRPYKPAWPVDQALDWIQKVAGTHLEQRLVGLFAGILPEILEIKANWDRRDSATK
jgi:putative two-component system response regulator